jgi:uncharacterized PurR-regulated membrane protein YhhQ (DUF165 family)
MEKKQSNYSETRNFWYVVFITSIVFVYIFCVTFCPIPKQNIRFVDIAFGFLLGTVLGSGVSYLLGGSPDKKIDNPATPEDESKR